MTELTANQFTLVTMVFSFTIGAMGVASLFFFCQRSIVLPRYNTAVTLLCVVCAFACFNYTRLYLSWTEAFVVQNGVLRATGAGFNELFRYTDWLLTVPLLLVALVGVLDVTAKQGRVRSVVLALLAVEMIALGYPGLTARSMETRWLWFGMSMTPFVLIVLQLFVTLRGALAAEPAASRYWVKAARFMLVLTWSVYPVIYLLPMLGVTGGNVFLATQIGYAAADLCAKALFGVLLCQVALSKSLPGEAPVAATGPGLPRAAQAAAQAGMSRADRVPAE